MTTTAIEKQPVKGYRSIVTPSGPERLHRVRAERALGRPLPAGAIVHHADGSKADDAPLVICENAAYHFLLHRRMNVKAAGGNPNTDNVCVKCRDVKPLSEFLKDSRAPQGVQTVCNSCNSARRRRQRGGN